MSEGETLDDNQKAIIENVEKFGWSVMHVTSDNPEAPTFCYSIGFEHTLGQPEVLVYSLRRDLAGSMVNALFHQCKDDGLELTDGKAIGNLIEGYDCVARPIEDPRAWERHFGYAMWFQRYRDGKELRRAMQIVWPDPDSRAFPWEENCSPGIRLGQIQLYPSGGPRV